MLQVKPKASTRNGMSVLPVIVFDLLKLTFIAIPPKG
jgi:hypothetical protein